NEESLEVAIQRHLPFPYSEVIVDTNKDGNICTFAAIKTEVASSYVEALCPLGFRIRALEIESQAIARLFIGEQHKNQTIIIGDIGHNHTTFLVVQQNHIDFTHTSKLISGKMLTEYIQTQFKIDSIQAERIKIEQQQHPAVQSIIHAYTTALANELRRVIDFHQEHCMRTQGTQYSIYFIGGGSQITHLTQSLQQQIHHPIQTATLSQHLSIPKQLANQFLSYSTAIGLSIRDFQPL
ncbi:MAG TPA: pilus assembly protein PilM, partial [Patescibacteria group bacterium]|nr:pilus assembly protein PilM [Patescibacteria group bacterium]